VAYKGTYNPLAKKWGPRHANARTPWPTTGKDPAMSKTPRTTIASNSDPLTVVHVPFRGDFLDAVQDGGKVWAPVRKVCEALGVDFSAQLKRLNRRPWATVAIMTTVAEDGKTRETACLELDSLPMWLATIDVKRVSPEAREKLAVYQKECARVLREHFFGRPQVAQAQEPTERQLELERDIWLQWGRRDEGGRMGRMSRAIVATDPDSSRGKLSGNLLRCAMGLDHRDSRFPHAAAQALSEIGSELQLVAAAVGAAHPDMVHSVKVLKGLARRALCVADLSRDLDEADAMANPAAARVRRLG